MRVVPQRRAATPPSRNRILTPGAPEFGFAPIMHASGASASGAWFSANDPLAIPFAVRETCVVHQLGWFNGSSAGGSFDVGVYTTSFARLVSTGSTAGSGSASFQWVDVADTTLLPGRYFLVMVINATTANRIQMYTTTSSALLVQMMGCYDSGTDAFPLPDPLTDMAPSTQALRLPMVCLATRELY